MERGGVDGAAGIWCSMAGGGVGRLDSGTQDARYNSRASSSISEKSLLTDMAGEYSMFASTALQLFLSQS